MSLPKEVKCEQLKAWLADKSRPQPVLLDVRRPDEHAYASIAGDRWIPLNELEERIDELADVKAEAIVTYCHHGIRSMSARMILQQHGFSVTSLKGGIDAWSLTVDSKVPRY